MRRWAPKKYRKRRNLSKRTIPPSLSPSSLFLYSTFLLSRKWGKRRSHSLPHPLGCRREKKRRDARSVPEDADSSERRRKKERTVVFPFFLPSDSCFGWNHQAFSSLSSLPMLPRVPPFPYLGGDGWAALPSCPSFCSSSSAQENTDYDCGMTPFFPPPPPPLFLVSFLPSRMRLKYRSCCAGPFFSSLLFPFALPRASRSLLSYKDGRGQTPFPLFSLFFFLNFLLPPFRTRILEFGCTFPFPPFSNFPLIPLFPSLMKEKGGKKVFRPSFPFFSLFLFPSPPLFSGTSLLRAFLSLFSPPQLIPSKIFLPFRPDRTVPSALLFPPSLPSCPSLFSFERRSRKSDESRHALPPPPFLLSPFFFPPFFLPRPLSLSLPFSQGDK